MPDQNIEQLNELLSVILDQLSTTKKIADREAAPSKSWPSLAEIEGVFVSHVLRHTRGNKQAAARILDVDRKTLDRMIKRHKIEVGTNPEY